MKKFFIFLCILLITSCKSHYITVEKEVPVETVKIEYKTNTQIDSVYIHDSINVYSIGDTIYKDKIKIVYKSVIVNDTICKTDSIEKPIYITTTEVTEVNKTTNIQKFFLTSGFILWVVLIVYIILKLRNKFST